MTFKKIFIIILFLSFADISLADEKMTLGLSIFNNKGQCNMCHTLKAAEAKGQIGPSLDLLKPQKQQIISVVSNGIGVMPSFKGTLSSEEIDAVAYFVFKNTNQ